MKHNSLVKLTTIFVFFAATHFADAAFFTNGASADAFVRSNAPTSNYGGAGALSVSGSTATNGSGFMNGLFDTFIRFNSAGMVSNFNSVFGTNNWVINGVKFRVTETAAPMNTNFNRGKGHFEVRWITNDNWIEGTGMPSTPTSTNIVYNDEATLLTPGVDATLGTFTNARANGTFSFPLALPSSFVNDLKAGGEVGLFLTPTDSGIGFTFNSVNFGTASQRPFLEISAVPQPGIASIGLSGTDVVLACTNGVTDGTYYALTSTNLSLPATQWSPVATNVLSANGDFTMTVTNGAYLDIEARQFFILRTQ